MAPPGFLSTWPESTSRVVPASGVLSLPVPPRAILVYVDSRTGSISLTRIDKTGVAIGPPEKIRYADNAQAIEVGASRELQIASSSGDELTIRVAFLVSPR
jgi:hypothetical protein